MPIKLPQQCFELSSILAHEEWRDSVEEDRVGVDQVHGIGDAKPLGTVGGSHADDEVAPVAQQLHRGDLDGLFQAVDPKDRCGCDIVEPLFESSRVITDGGPARQWAEPCDGYRAAEERAASL